MKILWLDLNSSYAHSSLALPALHAQIPAHTAEWVKVSATINENSGVIAAEIFKHNPDIIAATNWLFNHEALLHILARAQSPMPSVLHSVRRSGVFRQQRGISPQEHICGLRIQRRRRREFPQMVISMEPKREMELHRRFMLFKPTTSIYRQRYSQSDGLCEPDMAGKE